MPLWNGLPDGGLEEMDIIIVGGESTKYHGPDTWKSWMIPTEVQVVLQAVP